MSKAQPGEMLFGDLQNTVQYDLCGEMRYCAQSYRDC
jgi:hypothetical protein